MDGLVVAARLGGRKHYQPLHSKLCDGPEPHAVVTGLLSLHNFQDFYIADLNAICQTGNHTGIIRSLVRTFPNQHFWIDAGIRESADIARLKAQSLGVPVIGSETFHDDLHQPIPDDCVLSLDFSGEKPLGSGRLCTQTSLWPRRLIVMSLDRIGSSCGPDFQKLASIRERAPAAEIYAAGGVRDASDLGHLRAMQVTGALVASALHDGRVAQAEISALAERS